MILCGLRWRWGVSQLLNHDEQLDILFLSKEKRPVYAETWRGSKYIASENGYAPFQFRGVNDINSSHTAR